jgi:hypothetical protein
MMIVDINTRSDSDFIREFVYQTAALVPIDLTGSTLHMMARNHASDSEVALDLSISNGSIILTDPTLGKFNIFIPFTILSRLPARVYDHSLIRTRPDSILEEIWHGTLTHEIGPTR